MIQKHWLPPFSFSWWKMMVCGQQGNPFPKSETIFSQTSHYQLQLPSSWSWCNVLKIFENAKGFFGAISKSVLLSQPLSSGKYCFSFRIFFLNMNCGRFRYLVCTRSWAPMTSSWHIPQHSPSVGWSLKNCSCSKAFVRFQNPFLSLKYNRFGTLAALVLSFLLPRVFTKVLIFWNVRKFPPVSKWELVLCPIYVFLARNKDIAS